MERKGRVTLKQIAERAGCSVTAVSKTLNGARGTAAVGEATRARVMAVAEELGYTPNYLARALQRGRTQTIGLVSSFSPSSAHHNAFWGLLFQGVQTRLRDANHDVVMIGRDDHRDEVQRAVSHLRERRVDALIVPSNVYPDAGDLIDAADGPIVQAYNTTPGRHPSVGADRESGIAAMLEHLVALGHRRLLWVPLLGGGQITHPQRDEAVKRLAAARGDLELVECDLSVDALFDWSESELIVDVCRRQFAELLPRVPHCTAILAYSERVGMAICAALSDAGYRVPTDVSVASFDNIYGHVSSPPMTVVDSGLVDVGARAAELALAMIDEPDSIASYEGHVDLLPSRLVVRNSTAAPGRGVNPPA